MFRVSGQNLYLLLLAVLCTGLMGWIIFLQPRGTKTPKKALSREELTLEEISFSGKQAYGYLLEICEIGPRPSGSPGMLKQQELLRKFFEKSVGNVEFQDFEIRHPQDGSAVRMSNMIVRWQPEKRDRILLCAHYDTRPFPDRDESNPEGTFIGANDGASGTAILMQISNMLGKEITGKLGVDLVLFDGEEFVFSENDEYFLGATHFANVYATRQSSERYKWGVLLDMVADKDLLILPDRVSYQAKNTRPLVSAIFNKAKQLKVWDFRTDGTYDVRDDHLPLREIGKIPICDIIDFDYPHWHTQDDVPEKCSELSMAKVGLVITEWLKTAVK